MKRSDIQIGETYRVRFLTQNVACKVFTKQFFGFRMAVEYKEQGYGFNVYSCYAHKWSWKFLEGYGKEN